MFDLLDQFNKNIKKFLITWIIYFILKKIWSNPRHIAQKVNYL